MTIFSMMSLRSHSYNSSSETLLREAVREILASTSSSQRSKTPFVRERAIKNALIESVRSSHPVSHRQRLIFERMYRESGISRLLFEYRILLENAPGTVGEILATIDNRVSDMDSQFAQLVEEIIKFAEEFGAEEVAEGIQALRDLSKAPDEIKEIKAWFEKLKEKATGLLSSYKKSKTEAPDSIKKQLQYLFKNDREVVSSTLEHVKSIQVLYKKNGTFKAFVDSTAGAALKTAMQKIVEQVIKAIPYGAQIVAGLQMLVKAAEIGGKMWELFKKAQAAKEMSPQDKLAAVAKNIVRGKDEKLGEIGKILQLDDDLEATLDDKLEADFITWYVEQLRSVPPDTPLDQVDVNKVLTGWVKKVYGKPNVQIGLAQG